jgi:hypothetical protein
VPRPFLISQLHIDKYKERIMEDVIKHLIKLIIILLYQAFSILMENQNEVNHSYYYDV